MIREALANLETALKGLGDIDTALDEALIVAITDQRGIITFANEKFCKISKYSREELIGQNHRIINSGYHSKEFFRDMWRTIAHGKTWRGEIRNRAKDGSFYWMDTTIVPCLNEKNKPYQYVSFRIEITERKKTEEYLRRMDKIAAAAQLASAIAHEVRNPLAAMKWSLLNLQASNVEQSKDIDLILSEVDRIDSIVADFLLLARPQTLDFQKHDIKQLLNAIIQLMQIQAHRTQTRIVTDFDENVQWVRCEPNQLKQVFINVIKNAVEAMPDGGELRIELKALSEEQIVIRFIDQGCGMPDEILKKIGEPFYTTKEKGSGLGLMVCYQIVENHQGRMKISSEPNRGTTLEIFLPTEQSYA